MEHNPRADLLDTVMENEDILYHISKVLVDAGDLNFRLVCSRWRNCSRDAPIELGYVAEDDIPHAIATFPRASAIKIDCDRIRDMPLALARLSALPLKKLNITGETLWTINRPPVFTGFRELASLELILMPEDINWFMGELRHLTILTSLYVHTMQHMPSDADPILTLTKLEVLEIDISLLCNRNGEIIFPPTTLLTSMTVASCSDILPESQTPLLDVLSHYENIETLILDFDEDIYPDPMEVDNMVSFDWLKLENLKSLRILSAEKVWHGDDDTFFAILRLFHLTEVDVGVVPFRRLTSVFIAIEQLPLLRICSIEARGYDAEWTRSAGHECSRLTQLTHLTVANVNTGDGLKHLTQLKSLSVILYSETPTELVSTLTFLVALQRLKLEGVMLTDAIADSFRPLKLLTEVVLLLSNIVSPEDGNVEGEKLFHVLSEARDLKSLTISTEYSVEWYGVRHVALLRKLSYLEIGIETTKTPNEYIDAESLEGLEVLVINCPSFTETDERDLKRRIRSLRDVENRYGM